METEQKCLTCGQPIANYRVDAGDGTCNFCHENLDRVDNYGKPRWDYVHRLQSMTDKQLEDETKDRIWLSAYAANNPRSDYHWQCDFCYNECIRRGKEEIYKKAYDRVAN